MTTLLECDQQPEAATIRQVVEYTTRRKKLTPYLTHPSQNRKARHALTRCRA